MTGVVHHYSVPSHIIMSTTVHDQGPNGCAVLTFQMHPMTSPWFKNEIEAQRKEM